MFLLLFFAAATLFIKHRILSYPCDYGHMPRQELRNLYDAYREEYGNEPDWKPSQDYRKYLRMHSVFGTVYQTDRDLMIRHDWYESEVDNESFRVLSDYGKITFEIYAPNEPDSLFFDMCALAYQHADMVPRQLTIQTDADPSGFVLGYVRTVFRSPTGKWKYIITPLDGSPVVLTTRDGSYFLKEFSIFSAYSQDSYMQQDQVRYQVWRDEELACEFSRQRGEGR